MDTASIAFVLVVHNDSLWLEDMTRTLLDTEHPFDLYVVDNASDDNSTDVIINTLGDVYLSRSEQRKKFIECLNFGYTNMLEGGYEYMGMLHPDMRFDYPNWLTILVDAMDEHYEWGKLSPYNMKWIDDRNGIPHPDDVDYSFFPQHEAGFIGRREMWEQVGFYDNRFEDMQGYEDWDLHRRMISAGWEIQCAVDSRMWHYNGGTRTRLGQHDFSANREIYIDKWGDDKQVLGEWDL